MKRIHFWEPVAVLFLCASSHLYSQGLVGNGNARTPDFTMTSSEGNSNSMGENLKPGSLKNFVNMSTGALVYTVPFFEVQSYHLSVPVSIGYYSNGIRIDQESDPVGLGWSLNAGGAIVRKLKGKPDEVPNAFLERGPEIASYFSKSEQEKKNFIDAVLDNIVDAEPDIFQFSFPGGNGYFTFDNEGEIITYPHQKLKLTYDISGGNLYSFVITTSNGIEYHFGGNLNSVERTMTSSLSVPIDKNDVFESISVFIKEPDGPEYIKTVLKTDSEDWGNPLLTCDPFISRWYARSAEPEIDYSRISEENEITYTSKWHLTKIVHPDGDLVNFSYKKLDDKTRAQRPVVSQSEFDYKDNEATGEGYVPGNSFSQDDKHNYPFKFTCLLDRQLEDQVFPYAIYPRFMVYDYKYVNPDFYPIQNYSYVKANSFPPTDAASNVDLANYPQYSSPSWHYSLGLVTKGDIVLTGIETKSQRVEFNYIFPSVAPMLKSVVLYKDSVKLKEYILDNEIVTGSLDRLNLIEAILAKNVDFNETSIQNVKNLIDLDFEISNNLLEKYVKPGLKPELFQRILLKGIVLKSKDKVRRLLSFEYDSPEALPRSNSLFRSHDNYYVYPESDDCIQLIEHFSGEKFKVPYPPAISSDNYSPKVGIMKKIRLESGGQITFNFITNNGYRVTDVNYKKNEDADSISIHIDYVEREYDEVTNRFSEESNSSIIANSPRYTIREQKYVVAGHVPKLTVSSSEYLNDISWFNNELFMFSEVWIDYNGNGKEVFRFTTNSDVTSQIELDERFVHFIPQELFRKKYIHDGDSEIEPEDFEVEYVTTFDNYGLYPYSRIHSFHYATGSIKEHFILDNNENVLSRSVYNYEYNLDGYIPESCIGLKVGKLDRGMNVAVTTSYRSGKYTLKSVFPHLSSIEKYSFNVQDNSSVVTSSLNTIDQNHLQIKKQTGPGKDEQTQIVKVTLYPEDYTNTTGFIGKMKELNILAIPIEVVTYQVSASGEKKILSAELIEYNAVDPTRIENQYHLELKNPLGLSDFKFSNSSTGIVPESGSAGAFSKYSGYVKNDVEFKYDGFNRIYASKGEDGIWNGTLFHKEFNAPAAQVANQEIMAVELPQVIEKNFSRNVSEENNLEATLEIDNPQTIKISTTFISSSGETPNLKITVKSAGFTFQKVFYIDEFSCFVDLAPGKYIVNFNSQPSGFYSKRLNIEYNKRVYNAFFTSFENDGEESLQARSGQRIFTGSHYSFEFSTGSASDYVVSYWYLQDDKWRFSGYLPFEPTINLLYPIDDLRMHKKGARMTSFVYDDKGQLISKLDERGMNKILEYDEFGRLITERDFEDNITKKVEYFILGNN